MTGKLALFTFIASLAAPIAAQAQNFDDIIDASLLSGWRQSDGSHMAAIRLDLEQGWHTYWRAPGDAGIPPYFDMSGSGNFKSFQVLWPRPEVYEQNGLRSIVYHDSVVLPLRIVPTARGQDITLNAEIEIGICKDICIPKTLNVRAVLPAAARARDALIASALADRPDTGKEAGAQNVTCRISPTRDGVALKTTLTLPRVGRSEAMAIETADPLLWVGEPEMIRSGNALSSVTQIQHVEGAPFILNRSGIRITVLGESRAVEISGCTGQ
ncbi:protein-disulfide reductase DsbD domain-containing protein [Planktotalea arctica]|uniref:protein-disulfide reductase DsbD domain-containing protein n=1 Tax=Planktotalea arctica TaxID=1481893 RepID=UPI00321A0641